MVVTTIISKQCRTVLWQSRDVLRDGTRACTLSVAVIAYDTINRQQPGLAAGATTAKIGVDMQFITTRTHFFPPLCEREGEETWWYMLPACRMSEYK